MLNFLRYLDSLITRINVAFWSAYLVVYFVICIFIPYHIQEAWFFTQWEIYKDSINWTNCMIYAFMYTYILDDGLAHGYLVIRLHLESSNDVKIFIRSLLVNLYKFTNYFVIESSRLFLELLDNAKIVIRPLSGKIYKFFYKFKVYCFILVCLTIIIFSSTQAHILFMSFYRPCSLYIYIYSNYILTAFFIFYFLLNGFDFFENFFSKKNLELLYSDFIDIHFLFVRLFLIIKCIAITYCPPVIIRLHIRFWNLLSYLYLLGCFACVSALLGCKFSFYYAMCVLFIFHFFNKGIERCRVIRYRLLTVAYLIRDKSKDKEQIKSIIFKRWKIKNNLFNKFFWLIIVFNVVYKYIKLTTFFQKIYNIRILIPLHGYIFNKMIKDSIMMPLFFYLDFKKDFYITVKILANQLIETLKYKLNINISASFLEFSFKQSYCDFNKYLQRLYPQEYSLFWIRFWKMHADIVLGRPLELKQQIVNLFYVFIDFFKKKLYQFFNLKFYFNTYKSQRYCRSRKVYESSNATIKFIHIIYYYWNLFEMFFKNAQRNPKLKWYISSEPDIFLKFKTPEWFRIIESETLNSSCNLTKKSSYEIQFLRKNKVYNKGRYSRCRQNYRTGMYMCLLISVLMIMGLYFWFFEISFKFTYLWWLFIFFIGSFFLPKIINYRFYELPTLGIKLLELFKWYFLVLKHLASNLFKLQNKVVKSIKRLWFYIKKVKVVITEAFREPDSKKDEDQLNKVLKEKNLIREQCTLLTQLRTLKYLKTSTHIDKKLLSEEKKKILEKLKIIELKQEQPL